jgi:hypothetical protein
MTTMAMTGKTARKTLPPGIAKVLKRLHYPLNVILVCAVVRGLLAKPSQSRRDDG